MSIGYPQVHSGIHNNPGTLASDENGWRSIQLRFEFDPISKRSVTNPVQWPVWWWGAVNLIVELFRGVLAAPCVISSCF